MPLRCTTLLTAALLTAAPLAATALPASAATCTAPKVVLTQVNPSPVVVGATGTAGFDLFVVVRANGCAVSKVTALVTSPTKGTVDMELGEEGTEGGLTAYAVGLDIPASELQNRDAGSWRVRTATHWSNPDAVSSTTSDDDETEVEEQEPVVTNVKVPVLAASNLTARATSADLKKGKITKGKVLTVSGVLSRANWEAGRDTGYAKQKVDLQFRTTKGTFKKVRTLQTRSGGAFAEKVKVDRDGCYRVVFTGNTTTAPDPSKAECIDVR
jgi:hypothetical protein